MPLLYDNFSLYKIIYNIATNFCCKEIFRTTKL